MGSRVATANLQPPNITKPFIGWGGAPDHLWILGGFGGTGARLLRNTPFFNVSSKTVPSVACLPSSYTQRTRTYVLDMLGTPHFSMCHPKRTVAEPSILKELVLVHWTKVGPTTHTKKQDGVFFRWCQISYACLTSSTSFATPFLIALRK